MEHTKLSKITHKDNIIETLTIEGDGDCLFSSLAHQLYKTEPGTNIHIENTYRLRSEAVKHIKNNLTEYKNQIIMNIKDLSPKYDHLEQEQQIMAYCNDLSTKAFWGGAESIAAIANTKNKKIIVIIEGGGETIFETPEATHPPLKILYRWNGDRTARNHYDSILNITPKQKDPLGQMNKTCIANKTNEYNIIDIKLNTNTGNKLTTKTKSFKNVKHHAINNKGSQLSRTLKDHCTNKGEYPQKQHNTPYSQITHTLHINEINPPPENSYRISQQIATKSQTHKDNMNIRLATWNIRGCTYGKDRDIIDETLHNMQIDIATLQETHLNTGIASTEHYNWLTSGGKKKAKTTRGIAICINKKSPIIANRFEALSDSLASIKIQINSYTITLIAAHIPSDKRKWPIHRKIGELITKDHRKTHHILVGDFNAHIGKDKRESNKQWIGDKIYHNDTNENGDLILGFAQNFKMTMHNTWSSSNTVLTTWANGKSQSQIDHIMSTMERFTIAHTKATWKKEISTDHKILVATIKTKQINANKEEMKDKNIYPSWNINLLKNTEIKQQYQKFFSEISSQEEQENKENIITLESKWKNLYDKIIKSASVTLDRPKSPPTSYQRIAKAKYQQALFRRHKDPENPLLQKKLKELKLRKDEINNDHMEKKCLEFFKNSSRLNPYDRTSQLFKFLKNYKRKISAKKWRYMPMYKWIEMLQKSKGTLTQRINETDFYPLKPPPTETMINMLVKTKKWGTSPGKDRINQELISEGPLILKKEITEILKEAWISGETPQEWRYTIQVPLPKINNPKDISDYRPITLSNTIYKIYAKFLLHELDDHLGDAPSYQAAYIKERAADDHVFVVRRLLEERWNQGQISYILSMDLTKAFDKVSHKAIIKALKNKNTPHYLINRIITTCLQEKTSIQWCGQRTEYYDKSIGVKQGCPISPRLFSLVIDEILVETAKEVDSMRLEQTNKITVPITLAYADDLIFIAEKKEQLYEFINKLIPKLQATGLQLNWNKTHINIKDPIKDRVENRETLQIGDFSIKVQQHSPYLGTTITNKLSRTETVRDRIRKAYKTTYALILFIKKNRPSWNIIKHIYTSTIAPTATYGLKTTVLTKANRTSLRHMEKSILKTLSNHSSSIISKGSTRNKLRGKTINRRISVARLKYWAHIKRRPTGNLLKAAEAMKCTRRKIGRPCLTWTDALIKDKMKFNINQKDWMEIINDKPIIEKWMEKISKNKQELELEENEWKEIATDKDQMTKITEILYKLKSSEEDTNSEEELDEFHLT